MVLDCSLFGMKLKGFNNVINGTDHPYGFGGKEESNDPFDWKTLDFGARNYAPDLGRWMSLDPMAEMFYDWTPYKYSMNNPILLTDPDGNCEFCKKLLKSAWTTYKSTLSNTYEGAKKLLTSPVETIKKSATNHYEKLKTPQGIMSLTKQALSVGTGGVSDKVDNVAQAILSDDPATTIGNNVGENAAEKTVEAGSLLAGEVVGKGLSALSKTVSTSTAVTEKTIKKALEKSTMKTAQSEVSLPVVKRYVEKIKSGETAPAIKVDNGVIVDGNHRFVAGQVTGTPPAQVPGTLPRSSRELVKPVSELKVNPIDYGNQ